MRQPEEKTKHDHPGSSTATDSATADHASGSHRSRHIPMPKQLLDGTEICSRFDQISGQGVPKRMTTGKFVYLGPTSRLPDSPL